ncbi:hypothetical protein Taro_007310 [Colocasia esculenta]|uniref:glucan endo-1,3-beta-D-glucosidase n=1 Tax=Colocasia esculenta TaxID=4460 RepID=A0A843U029_COLES|nr:hypothetical protein [Colocasia esculenta]
MEGRSRRGSAGSRSAMVLLFSCFLCAASQPFIGVNYGEVADNLPPPAVTAKLLQSTSVSKLRLYGANAAVIQAFANTPISLVIATSNGDIPSLAGDPNAAAAWVAANVLSYYPASAISTISVGNEVLLYGDANLAAQLLPAMQNLRAALAAQSLVDKIKVSTVHPMSVLVQSDPPSSGTFDPAHADQLRGILGFLQQTGSPFMINPYPFFAYRSDPRPETLAFCLFQPNQGRFDAGSQKLYTNMFDAQVDAVRSAMNREGFAGVDIVVAETGWPYRGDPDEVGVSVDNAKAYNGGLVAHLRSLAGTPLMPGKSVDTYLFALYDENLKPGPTSERSFGLYRPSDQAMVYDAGLAKSSQSQGQVTPSPAPASKKPAGWCVPKTGVSDSQLQANLDYACAQPGVDCSAIQPDGACYNPNTVASHASYAMNMLYQAAGRHPYNCDFRQTATVTSKNPSTASFPSVLKRWWLGWLRETRLHCVASWHTAALAVVTCVVGARDLRKGMPWLYYSALVTLLYFVDLSLTAFLILMWCLFVYSFLES